MPEHESEAVDAMESTSPKQVDERLPLLRRMRFRLTETKVRVPVIWYRHRGFETADIFLASYPKSGSTWLRFQLFEALTGDSAEFGSVNEAFRTVGEHLNAPRLLPGGGRLIGTHEQYRPAYHKVVYLVRDVRNVALSQFPREKHMGVGPDTLDEYLLRLMTGRKRHGAWHQHALSYLNSELAANGQLLVVHYEELRQNTEEVISRILDFFGIVVDRDAIRRAIANNSLEAMRMKEDRVHSLGMKVRRHPYKTSQEEGRFVRKGLVGGWRDKLTEQQLALIERYAGEALARLGYPLTTTSPELQTA